MSSFYCSATKMKNQIILTLALQRGEIPPAPENHGVTLFQWHIQHQWQRQTLLDSLSPNLKSLRLLAQTHWINVCHETKNLDSEHIKSEDDTFTDYPAPTPKIHWNKKGLVSYMKGVKQLHSLLFDCISSYLNVLTEIVVKMLKEPSILQNVGL